MRDPLLDIWLAKKQETLPASEKAKRKFWYEKRDPAKIPDDLLALGERIILAERENTRLAAQLCDAKNELRETRTKLFETGKQLEKATSRLWWMSLLVSPVLGALAKWAIEYAFR